MAASILSQDILAICLLMADGDVELSIEEIILRVENYQEDNDRHFGITRNDFRSLFNNLIYFKLELINIGEKLNDIKLEDAVIEILSHYDAYFNDEGEHWTKDSVANETKLDSRYIEYWYGYNKNEYQEKLILKHEMERFFKSQYIIPVHPELVKEFIKKMGITDDILLTCSRSGKSS